MSKNEVLFSPKKYGFSLLGQILFYINIFYYFHITNISTCIYIFATEV